MALIQDNRGFSSLIQLTAGGLNIADYPTIKRAIVEKYKEIYGSDIDLNNTTADGVFIETLSLMIFNILQNVKYLYSNLDIRTASGKFLESLAALSGVYRNSATKSQTQLELTNLSDSAIQITASSPLKFLDQAGLTWSTQVLVNSPISLEKGVLTLVDVYCDNVGPVSAPKGWITTLVENNTNLKINQPEDANIGSFDETDSELRSRRNQIISSQGVTVLSNLIGSLLNITGIADCVIYNNDSGSSIIALDGTSILAKSIYVVLRKDNRVQIDDSIIGSRIYEKLTPGINTNQFSGQANTGINKSYEYVQSSTLGEGTANVDVYWKECTGINNKLKIIIFYRPGKYFSSYENATITTMTEAVKNYLNELSINENFTTYDLIQTISDEDPMFDNQRTYNVIDVKLEYSDTTLPFIATQENDNLYNYQTKDTFFDINTYSTEKDDTQVIKKLTITVTT